MRAWLLHLVKVEGDVCAAYRRPSELTALVIRGIASERIPPANDSSITSHRTTLRGEIWLALWNERRDRARELSAARRPWEGVHPAATASAGRARCAFRVCAAAVVWLQICARSWHVTKQGRRDARGRAPVRQRRWRVRPPAADGCALAPHSRTVATAAARSANGHFVSDYASLKRACRPRATTAAMGCRVSIGARNRPSRGELLRTLAL